MRRARFLMVVPALAVLAAVPFGLTGCKAQQQLQTQIADMDAKLADSQRRITALDSELKKATFEIGQLKGLITKLGNVTVDLQKAEEDRQKAVAEAKARAEAAKSKTGAAKKKPAPPAKKKK